MWKAGFGKGQRGSVKAAQWPSAENGIGSYGFIQAAETIL